MLKTHPLNSNIALPDDLSQLKVARRQDGKICLSDEFRTYQGLIYKSPELQSISESFDYEAHGYGALVEGPGMPERAAFASYTNGILGPVQQGKFLKDGKMATEDLEFDLKPYEEKWRILFESFGKVVSPFVQNFEIRLKCLQYPSEDFHKDKDVVGILPMGPGRRSTVCKGEKGENIYPEDGSFVTTTPLLKHSSPVSDISRAGLAITKLSHDIR